MFVFTFLFYYLLILLRRENLVRAANF